MKKLILLFLFFVFISCSRDSLYLTETNVSLKTTIDEDGIVSFTFKPITTASRTASDTLCFLYEALRFIKDFDHCPYEEGQGTRTRVNTRLRLVKISKLTLEVTPITEWTTFNNVGGLNISWYLQPPLSDYWYSTQFDYCYQSYGIGNFWLLDFWGDDGMRVHMEPFTAYDVKGCAYAPVSQGATIAACTLNSDCTITE